MSDADPTTTAAAGSGAPLRRQVARHYDVVSAHYRRLWGRHLHHGYYERGDESKEDAALMLLERLVGLCEIEPGSRVLDVGCGFGGTCGYLRSRLGCDAVGITLSVVQARMARDESVAWPAPEPPARAAPEPAWPGSTRGAPVSGGRGAFLVGDASRLPVRGRFDHVLAIEVLSHLEDRDTFFARAAALLRPGGRIGIAAWLRAEGLGDDERRRFIEPIERGMLVRLPDIAEYRALLDGAGLEPLHLLDISERVAPTWDLCIEMLADPALWSLAATHGGDVIDFLRSFTAMRRGFASGALRFGLLVAGRARGRGHGGRETAPFPGDKPAKDDPARAPRPGPTGAHRPTEFRHGLLRSDGRRQSPYVQSRRPIPCIDPTIVGVPGRSSPSCSCSPPGEQAPGPRSRLERRCRPWSPGRRPARRSSRPASTPPS